MRKLSHDVDSGTGSRLEAARVLVGLARRPDRARRALPPLNPQVENLERRGPGSALPQLLSTLTDEFAFRRISRVDARVLPIQIEHHWQEIAASTLPLPYARLPR